MAKTEGMDVDEPKAQKGDGKQKGKKEVRWIAVKNACVRIGDGSLQAARPAITIGLIALRPADRAARVTARRQRRRSCRRRTSS